MSAGRRPPALSARLSRRFALLSLAGLGAVCLAVYLSMALVLARQSQARLDRYASVVGHVLAEFGAGEDLAPLRHKLDDFLTGQRELRITLDTAEGHRLYRSAARPAEAAPFAAGSDAPPPGPAAQPAPAPAARWLASRRELAWAGGPVRLDLQLDVSDTDRLLRTLAWTLAAATLAGAALIGAVGYRLVRHGLAPLRALGERLDGLSAERLDQRLAADEPVAELQPWIDRFNALMARLEASYRQLEAFNADVAHELRTPLATLISRSELDLSGARDAAALRASAEANLEDLQRLAAIVNDMLFLSRADRGAPARLGPPSALAAEAREVAAFHEAWLDEAGLGLAIEGDARLAYDAGLVRRALSNLLSNAIRHAAPGSCIRVRIEPAADGGAARVWVENLGAALDPDTLPRLFDRFYRAEPAREGGAEHHGLGLAIVAGIARMHGGEPLARADGPRVSIGFSLQAQAPDASFRGASSPGPGRPSEVRNP